MKALTAENEFNPIKLLWDVHPERDYIWFEKETKNLSEKQIAQELLCDFAASGETFLNVEDIEFLRTCVMSPLERWGPEMRVWVWKYALSEHQYIVSADIARGDGKDYSTFHVIDTTESEIVAEYKGKIPPDQFAVLLNEVGMRYNKAIMCPESNTYGYAVLMKLQELRYPNIYFEKEKDRYSVMYGNGNIGKAGFSTQGPSRAKILTKLEEVIRNKQVKIYSSRLYEEMKTFIWRGSKVQAMRDKNDDLVMALAIGVWLYDTSAGYNKQSVDLNAAMLAGFAVNTNAPPRELDPNLRTVSRINPFKPVIFSSAEFNEAADNQIESNYGPFGDLSWLIK
jgi:hypothetical protein